LRRKVEFERLLRRGVRQTVEGYTFYIGRRENGAPRLGLLVTRQHSARAVERNRIKRCIREAFRLAQETLGALDVLVRPPFGVKASPQMIERLQSLLRKLAP
jgi:ribonuclease P protein component